MPRPRSWRPKPTHLLALSLLLWTACSEDACDPQVLRLAPRISVDACKDELGTAACAVDFGEVALSTRVQREIIITNPSGIPLTLQEPYFSDNSDPAFRVDHWPDRIDAGLSSTMLVSYRPLVEAAVSATLLLPSDAVNLNGVPIEIAITGSGVDNGLPQVEVVASAPCQGSYPGSTDVVDMGITAVGNPLACTFEVYNRGTKDLVVERIELSQDSAHGFGFVGRIPGVDPDTGERFESVIPPPEAGSSSSRSFVVRGVPQGLGIFGARVLVHTNDPGCVAPAGDGSCAPEDSRTIVVVPVQIEGAHTPNAAAHILSVNGQPYSDGDQIEPLDDVVLTGEDSTASSRNLRLVEYHWEIINQPVGSHGTLDDSSSATPRFVFDNSGNMLAGIDLAGFWEVRLTVTDSRGAASVNEAVVSFNAIPNEAIHIQLVWDHPNSDVDLHLLREQADGSYEPRSGQDCYYANCKVSYGGLTWFSNDPEANPTLDVDDLYGYGPENINIKTPQPGRYKVAVHYFSDHGEGDTVAVIRLFLFGSLHSEYLAELTDDDWWEVAVVEWPSRDVEIIDTVNP